MFQTFELYLSQKDGPGRVQVISCRRDEVIRRAREFLEHSKGDEVDVRCGGEYQFTLAR